VKQHSFLDMAEKDAQIRRFEQASADFKRAVVSGGNLLRNLGR